MGLSWMQIVTLRDRELSANGMPKSARLENPQFLE